MVTWGTDVEAGQAVLHALGAFLAGATRCLARELPRAPRTPSASLLGLLAGRGAGAGHTLPLAPDVLRTLRAQAVDWVVPLRDSALGPLPADTALLAAWHDQTLHAWLPAVVCRSPSVPTHVRASCLCVSRPCVCLAYLLCSLGCLGVFKKTMFCTGCFVDANHDQDNQQRVGDGDDDGRDKEEQRGCPLRVLRGSPALVQAICAFCLPTIGDNIIEDDDSDSDSESDSESDDEEDNNDDDGEHE